MKIGINNTHTSFSEQTINFCKNEIVVIGGNHHNTLGVLRSLGRKGVCPNLILTFKGVKPYVSYSKYINKLWIVENSEEAIKVLKREFLNEQFKTIVITCHDVIASVIDNQKDELLKNFIIPHCSTNSGVTYWMNKKNMVELAEKIGFRVPKSWDVKNIQSELNNIIYPCIIKPIISINGKKSDFCICRDRLELEEYIQKNTHTDLQIQEYIDKLYEYQFIGCSINNGEDIIIPGVSNTIHGSGLGVATGFLHYVNLDKTHNVELCKRFIKEIGYSGLFSIEMIRTKEGIDYFLEMNFRNDGNAICVTEAGVNLPYIWYLNGCNKPYAKELNSIKEIFVMPEFNELTQFLQRKISLKEFVKDLKLSDCFNEYAKDDKRPFFRILHTYSNNLYKIVLRKLLKR